VPAERIHLNATVEALELRPDGVRLSVNDGSGIAEVEADFVIAALPPLLLAATIPLSPAVASEVSELWRSSPTWMAAQAKFYAFYDESSWLRAGYSGTAQSLVGPMLEIDDATTRSGKPALFGFLGVSPAQRLAIGEAALTEGCIAQFARIFGPEALHPSATLLKDWASDPLTSTVDDPVSTGHGPHPASWVDGPWSERLILAGSETSPREVGYLAGAAEASASAAADIRSGLNKGELG
jgi:monoamine oxidase